MFEGTSDLLITMIPIVILFVILGIAMAYKHGKGAKLNKSQAESNAIIEAQAMLAKMQKEQSEKDAQKSEKEDTVDAEADEKPMSENDDSEEEKSKEEDKSAEEEKTFEKPVAEAPISDTTDLEPDIDKSATE
jgi:biopolymer transport protein ExbB/TolQ